MNYCVLEYFVEEGTERTAGVKARDDAEEVFERLGFKAIKIPATKTARANLGKFQKLHMHRETSNKWRTALSSLLPGDTLLIQFPNLEHSIFLPSIIKKYVKKGVKVVLLIHDLEMIRTYPRKETGILGKWRILLEEKRELNLAHKIIVHNKSMMNYLKKMGIPENKMVDLQIFDYLIRDCNQSRMNQRQIAYQLPVIVAGNLKRRKAGYVYHLDGNVPFNLYGVGYEGTESANVHYLGSREPDELPYEMSGSFGLVWDGTETSTCAGAYGDYLRVNNPHKTSLYLSSEIPVLIWKEAALASFVEKNHCGIAIESLDEIENVFANLSQEEYQRLKQNTERIAVQLRNGEFLKQALVLCDISV